jgi:hypothetical protein
VLVPLLGQRVRRLRVGVEGVGEQGEPARGHAAQILVQRPGVVRSDAVPGAGCQAAGVGEASTLGSRPGLVPATAQHPAHPPEPIAALPCLRELAQAHPWGDEEPALLGDRHTRRQIAEPPPGISEPAPSG